MFCAPTFMLANLIQGVRHVDQMSDDAVGEWATETAAALRRSGLLQDWDSLPEEEAAGRAREELRKSLEWAEEDDLWRCELMVSIAADSSERRHWWVDCECDPRPDYHEVLQELSRISGGTFNPSEVEEQWDEGRHGDSVTVRFLLPGNPLPHELRPLVDNDWLDTSIIDRINPLIAASGRQFVIVERDDQTACFLALADGEQQALEGRGWRFESPEERTPEARERRAIDWESVLSQANDEINESLRLSGSFLTLEANSDNPVTCWIKPLLLSSTPSPDFYMQTLEEWATLSGGALQLHGLLAVPGPDDTILIRFLHEGKAWELRARRFGGKIFDATILFDLNPMVESSGSTFGVDEILEDWTAIVGFASAEERVRITREREIRFETRESLEQKLHQLAALHVSAEG